MCAVKVDWDSLGGDDDGNQKSAFLKFKAGHTVTVRPVGHAVEFYRFYIEGETPKIVIVDPENKDEASRILSKHTGKEMAPTHRFAINVIDREDQQIKIMEGGWSIFKFFANWAKLHNSHPGGKAGADWSIGVKGEKLNREYTPMAGQSTPFTPEEVERIKEKKELYSLSDMYKPCPLDELIAKAFGESDDVQKPEEVAASADSDDPADW